MSAAIHANHKMPALLVELQHADHIIIAMLNAMTTAQKSKVHAQLETAGVSGEGMTRHHERRAVIVAAEVALAQPVVEKVQPDPLDHALDAVNVADVAVSFINANIHPVMSAIVEFSKSDSMDVGDNRRRMSQIKALARLGCQLVDEAAAHMESDQDEMHAKLAALQGGAA
ncbi:MAG: hypothetical protein JWP34_5312 [Massilia sp.]|nr:hypothetical protein [Massilia sp.]